MQHYSYLLQHELCNTAKNNGDKTAFIINNTTITYNVFYQNCLFLVSTFKSMKVVRGDRVLICAGNSYSTMISFWAALFCDAVPCIIDNNFSDDVLSAIIKNIAPKIIIEDDFNEGAFFKKDNATLCDQSITYKNTESDLAMIMHTSGSTGIPKGVMLSHRNVLSAIYAIRSYLDLKKEDIILSVLPLHFDYGLYQMLLSISLGATLILEKNALFPNKIANLIPRYHVTVLPCVPSLVQLFYVYNETYPGDFSSIRLVTNTGENLSVSHIQKIKKIFSSAVIFSMYGLTECKRCSYVPHAMLDKKPESIGIPMPNLEMWIQDNEGNRLPAQHEGNLVISGPTVMMGYWNNKEATHQKIVINPIGKRILLSGDKALMDDEGYFYFKGRDDAIVKYKGAKLVLHEYVNKLSAIEAIARSYLLLSQGKLIVCVETAKNKDDQDQLTLSILKKFPVLQKPDHIFYLNQFPSLSNGKIDKSQLEKNVYSHFNSEFVQGMS